MASGNSDFKIESDDLKALRKHARKFKDDDLKVRLKTTNRAAAQVVVDKAQPLAPVATGKLRDSIRALGGPSGGAVAGGGAKVPYFGWIDFGGAIKFKTKQREPIVREFHKEGRILWKALHETRDKIKAQYESDMKALLKEYGLDD